MEKLQIPQLTEALQRRTLALFIGADLPREVTGLPSRADLARELARRHGLDESLSLAEVAQRVGRAGNRFEFTDFIRNALDTSGKPPQSFHRNIVALVKAHQIETLITTACDNLLELAFREAGVAINRVVRGSDVSFVNPDRPTLIQLYGDAQQPDTLVVTDRDHSDLLRDREKEPLLDEVRRALRLNTVLFLGYNLADPDFRFLFDHIAKSRFARTAYAVWPGLAEDDARMWGDRGIVILDSDPLGILGEIAAQPAPHGRTEATIPAPAPSTPSNKQLAEARANLQLIEEREAEYVMSTDVPLQLVKEKRRLQQLIAELEAQAEETTPAPGGAPAPPPKGDDDEPSGPAPTYGAGKRWAVEAIRERLVTGGFDPARIRLLTDRTDEPPTRANILVALKAVADATEPDDLLLFYYSGHGDESGGDSYLVAQDGRRLVLGDTGVRLARVREIVESAPARARVIVLDACHSGADIGGKGPRPMTAEFIRRVFEQAEGMAILASCKQGQLSYEWHDNERSVFTHFLLEALTGDADRDEKGFVTVQDASRHVTDGVKLWASQRNVGQTPTLQYTVAGDIILVTVPGAGGTNDN